MPASLLRTPAAAAAVANSGGSESAGTDASAELCSRSPLSPAGALAQVLLRPAASALLLLLLPTLVSAYCPNACSGNGLCESHGLYCKCFTGYTGADCSERSCPAWKAWAGSPNATDTAHADYTECSNMGLCNRQNGKCRCEVGFWGDACQYMVCPGFLKGDECSGHGLCVSMEEAAELKNDISLFRETTYKNIWDHDMIRGCACDYGWEGFDCSQKSCPKGDDPGTTGQINEVQVVECRCPGTCSGNFSVSLFGQTTGSLSPQAPAEDMKTALEKLTRTREVSVKLFGGVMLCDSDGVDIQIEFVRNPGYIPPVKANIDSLAGSLGAASLTVVTGGTAGNNGAATSMGTRENVECSNRGTCDHKTGFCTCYEGYSSSDGSPDAEGTAGECGYKAPSHTPVCPTVTGVGICNVQGVCDDTTKTCACVRGYTGADCSLQTCPVGRAWFDEATSADIAHADGVECSNMGLCTRTTGMCDCDPRMEGPNCMRLKCPSGIRDAGWALNQACSGSRGQCLTLQQLAVLSEHSGGVLAGYTYGMTDEVKVWDWESTQGCSCSRAPSMTATRGGWVGSSSYDCAQTSCPTGDDPMTSGVDEKLKFNCVASAGTFYLRFRQQVTVPIAFDANAATVKAALEALASIGTVQVEFLTSNDLPDSNDQMCRPDFTGTRRVTFLTEHGDVPKIRFFESYSTAISGLASDEVSYFKTSAHRITGGSAGWSWTATLAECQALCSGHATCGAIVRASNLADGTSGSCEGWVEATSALSSSASHNTWSKAWVKEEVQGTKEDVECSNRGVCDHATGRCDCYAGFASSDGTLDNVGIRGDCGFQEKLQRGAMSRGR